MRIGCVFLAESCKRVLTTARQLCSKRSVQLSPHIGLVPVAVMMPAMTAALRCINGLSSDVWPAFSVGALGNLFAK